MYYLITILIIIACVLMTLIVLVQNSKGGGLTSTFAASNQIMGVRKTADFLEKATWVLAISLVVLSLLASITIPRTEARGESMVKEQVEKAVVNPNAIPNMPSETNK